MKYFVDILEENEDVLLTKKTKSASSGEAGLKLQVRNVSKLGGFSTTVDLHKTYFILVLI